MVAATDSLSIKGTPLSGRPWKKEARPKRALSKSGGAKSAEERNRQKWLAAQAVKSSMKEVAAEASEAVKQAREARKIRSQKIKQKREKQQANEIRSAGNNVVVVNNKKVSKMSKKARRKLMKMTPEMMNLIKQK